MKELKFYYDPNWAEEMIQNWPFAFSWMNKKKVYEISKRAKRERKTENLKGKKKHEF